MRKRVIVRGLVQGVGFRWSAGREADALGLSGHARNLADGSVEVEIEGPDAAVERMTDWLAQGPSHARVDAVEVTELGETGKAGFELG